MKRAVAVLAAVLMGTVGLTACGSDGGQKAEHVAVCINKQHKRVKDKNCTAEKHNGVVQDESGLAFLWYYIAVGNRAPAIGSPATGGILTVPKTGGVGYGDEDEKGGTVQAPEEQAPEEDEPQEQAPAEQQPEEENPPAEEPVEEPPVEDDP